MVSTRARGRGGGGAAARSSAPAPATSTPSSSLITEPPYPAWAAVAAVLAAAAALAVLPGAPAASAAAAALEAGALARRRAARWGAAAAWRAAAAATSPVLAADAAVGLAAFAFFKGAEAYGRARHARRAVPPYRGPWLDGPGRAAPSVPPRWFAPGYLLVALTAAFLVPLGALVVHAVAHGTGGAPHPAVAAALIPYLALFLFQFACEMALLRRSWVAPTIPLAFMLVRPWQLVRGLALARGHGVGVGGLGGVGGGGSAAWPPAPAWCPALLAALAFFWVFDTAALLVWLPWTYNWHLQGRGV